MDTIKQKVISIAVEGQDAINVRRMAWKPALDLLQKVSAQAGDLMPFIAQGKNDSGATTLRLDMDGLMKKLAGTIAQSGELASHLIEHSTGLGREQVDKNDVLVNSEIFHAALRLNFGDELKNSWLEIGKTLAGLFSSMTKSGARSTPTS